MAAFEGKENKDILNWLEEVKLVSRVAMINEAQIAKLIILKIENKTREWIILKIKDKKKYRQQN